MGAQVGRATILVTGMSGTGKSTALAGLRQRGHRVVDTDDPGWIRQVATPHGIEPMWDLDRVRTLLDGHRAGWLFVAGCVANQGALYHRFDAVVLLSAPIDVIRSRVIDRVNPFGSRPHDRTKIASDLAMFEPLLRAGADREISTTVPAAEVVTALERIAAGIDGLTGSSEAAIIETMDTFRFSDSVVIEAPPEFVYDLVTDIGRTGEWSPICRGCWWRDEQGARPGAWFVGRNEADGQVWETESQVAVADRGREFAWLVGGQYVRWGYQLDPVGGGTRLTESWDFLPAGQTMFRQKYGAAADDRIALRRSQAMRGIPATLAAIKRIAEAERPA